MEINQKQPVLICGLARSGSTWLSKTLGQSRELEYIGEAWLALRLHELNDWYKMLHDEWQGFTPWANRGVTKEIFKAQVANFYRNLLYTASGNKRFIEKTPNWNVQHLKFLHNLFPDMYYILLYRDGRNQVASLEAKCKRDNQNFNFKKACRLWAQSMDLFKEIKTEQFINRFIFVRYEDLLDNFESVFEDICEFTQIEYFTPRPFSPNSAFDNNSQSQEFNHRWKLWAPDKKKQFKQIAGTQLIKWQYVTSDEW